MIPVDHLDLRGMIHAEDAEEHKSLTFSVAKRCSTLSVSVTNPPPLPHLPAPVLLLPAMKLIRTALAELLTFLLV